MSAVFDQFLNGLDQGAVYALMASGVAIIFGVVQLVNFAHGQFYVVAAYVLFELTATLPIPYALAIGLTVVLMAGFGIIVELLVIRPIVHRSWQSQLVATLGLSVFLTGVATVVFGTYPLHASSPLTFIVARIGSTTISMQRLLLFGVTVVAFVVLNAVVRWTKPGKAMRAVSQNRDACVIVGIDAQYISMVAFAIGAGLAGLAAALYIPLVWIAPNIADLLIIKAFVVVIMGGFGRIDATIASAFILGEAEAFTTQYISATYVDAVSMVVMVAVLIGRPNGLFGKKVGI